MKRFVDPPFSGGLPTFNSDLVRMEQNDFNLIKGQLTAARQNIAEGVVVFGCEVTDNAGLFDLSAGAVFLDGELYLVEANSANSFPRYIVADADVDETRTFRDGASKNALVTKTATLQNSIPGSGQYISILDLQAGLKGEWVNFADRTTAQNGWAFSSSQPLQFRKNIDGTVEIRGNLVYDNAVVTSTTVIDESSALDDIVGGDNTADALGGQQIGIAEVFDGTNSVITPVIVQSGLQFGKFGLIVATSLLGTGSKQVSIHLRYHLADF